VSAGFTGIGGTYGYGKKNSKSEGACSAGCGLSKKLARVVSAQLSQKSAAGKRKWTWLAGAAAVAAVAVLVFVLNFVLYSGRTDIVYAMEQAYKEVKAYHGILSIVETNLNGEETLQAMREVWADSEGRYYVKELQGFQKGLITVNNGEKSGR